MATSLIQSDSIDAFTSQLARARRRWIFARLIDTAAIAFFSATLIYAVLRLTGWPAMWVWPVAAGVVLVLTKSRMPSLRTVAERLDQKGATSDLFSSAWLVKDELAESWSRLIYGQASARIGQVAESVNWHWLSSQLRTSSALGSLALLAVTALIRPAAPDSPTGSISLAIASSLQNESAPPWIAPAAMNHSNEDAEEVGRSIAMSRDAAVKRPGDNGSGHGRADARDVMQIQSAAANSSVETPLATNDAVPGSGNANTTAGRGDQSSHGTVAVADKASLLASATFQPGQANPSDSLTDADTPTVSPVYRDLIRAFFQR